MPLTQPYSLTRFQPPLRSVWGRARLPPLSDAEILERGKLQLLFAGTEALLVTEATAAEQVQPHPQDCGSCQEHPALCIYGWRPVLGFKKVSEKLHFFAFFFFPFWFTIWKTFCRPLWPQGILKNYKSKSSAIFSGLPHEHTGLFSTYVFLSPTKLDTENKANYRDSFATFGKDFETNFLANNMTSHY